MTTAHILYAAKRSPNPGITDLNLSGIFTLIVLGGGGGDYLVHATENLVKKYPCLQHNNSIKTSIKQIYLFNTALVRIK